MIKDLFIKDLLEDVVSGMTTSIEFRYGYWPEMHDELIDEAKDPAKRPTRYPFIFCHADYEEDKTEDYYYSDIQDLKIYVIALSEKNYSTINRESQVFETVIYPLYNSFITGILESHKFSFESDYVPHKLKKLHYHRGQDPDKENQLAEFVEVLEITIPSLKIFKEYTCQ